MQNIESQSTENIDVFAEAENMFALRELSTARDLYQQLRRSGVLPVECSVRLALIALLDESGNDAQNFSNLVDICSEDGILNQTENVDLGFWHWFLLVAMCTGVEGERLSDTFINDLLGRFASINTPELQALRFLQSTLFPSSRSPKFEKLDSIHFAMNAESSRTDISSRFKLPRLSFVEFIYLACELHYKGGKGALRTRIMEHFWSFQQQVGVWTVQMPHYKSSNWSQLIVKHFGNDAAGWSLPISLLFDDMCVYSGGVGNDFSFDVELCTLCKPQLFAFDPTPKGISYGEVAAAGRRNFHFIPEGLWTESGSIKFYYPFEDKEKNNCCSINNPNQTTAYMEAPVTSIPDFMQRMGHSRVDVLKIDIEGSEYEVLPSIIEAGIIIPVICTEVHGRKDVPYQHLYHFLARLCHAGYHILNFRKHDFTLIHDSALEGLR